MIIGGLLAQRFLLLIQKRLECDTVQIRADRLIKALPYRPQRAVLAARAFSRFLLCAQNRRE